MFSHFRGIYIGCIDMCVYIKFIKIEKKIYKKKEKDNSLHIDETIRITVY